jgi:hypothetical protein
VDISSRLPKDSKLPTKFPSFIFRNYAVIKDGLVNIAKLPVRVTKGTHEKLITAGVQGINHPVFITDPTVDLVIDLQKLPIINRKMVKDVSAKVFFETQYNLLQAQAEQKVYNSFSKDLLPSKKSEGFVEKYGEDAATWLKEQGFTDYSGFSPKTVQAEAVDFYMGKELKVNLKGLSSLPSLNELRKQIAKGKVNAAGSLMLSTFNLVEGFLKSEFYLKAADKDATLKAWLKGQTDAAKTKTRGLLYQVAQTTFALIVGQIWFSEFTSLDENSMIIDINGNKVDCKAEMQEIEIKI